MVRWWIFPVLFALPVQAAEPARLAHEGVVYSAVFMPDGRQIITAGQDGFIRVWDVKTRREVRQWPGHEKGVLSIALTKDGKTLVSGGRDSMVRLWDLASGKEIKKLTGFRGDVEGVTISGDGKMLAATGTGRSGSFRTSKDRNVFT